jgi:hypothetical protein
MRWERAPALDPSDQPSKAAATESMPGIPVRHTATVTDNFEAWLDSLHLQDPDPGGDVGQLAPGAREVLRDLLDQRGPIPREEVDRVGQELETALAERAVSLVSADIRSTTDLTPDIAVWRDEDGSLVVSYNGNYSEPAFTSMREPEAICDVADNLRDHVMDDLWTVWPQCPTDEHGLDPRVVDGVATWCCRLDNHVVSPIGELPLRTSGVPSLPVGGERSPAPEIGQTARDALAIVQADLDASGLGQFRMRFGNAGSYGHPAIFAALPDGNFWSGSGIPVDHLGTDLPSVLLTVVGSVQDTLAEVERTIWPRCAQHGDRLAVAAPSPDSPDGWPVWWCDGTGGHVLAPIGHLVTNRG